MHTEMNFVHNWYSLVYTVLAHDHLSLWHCFERALGYGAPAAEIGFGFFPVLHAPESPDGARSDRRDYRC